MVAFSLKQRLEKQRRRGCRQERTLLNISHQVMAYADVVLLARNSRKSDYSSKEDGFGSELGEESGYDGRLNYM